MNLNELNYIRCIAAHQNLTKAAQELYISQPTLSKSLQKTERELGVKLFHRIDNCYLPTHIGRQYLAYSEKMMELSNDWEKELKDLKEENAGELNIVIPLMRSSCIVPEILPLFHQKHPNIRVNFMEETYAVQERLLLDNCVDFAIFNEALPHPKLIYEELGREEILLILAKDHPLVQSGVEIPGHAYPLLELEKLKAEQFIMLFPEQTTGQIARTLLQKHGVVPDILFQTRNIQAAVALAAKGLGVCFSPESYIRQTVFECPPVCFSVEKDGVFSPLMAAYRKGAYLSDYARDFIELAKSIIN